MAIALAFRIDPPHRPQNDDGPPPQPSPPTQPAPQVASPPAAPPDRPRAILGAGVWADFASAPSSAIATPTAALGLSVDAGVRVGSFAISAEVRWNPRAGSDLGSSRVGVALLPCAYFATFERVALVGCVDAEAGHLWWSVSPGDPPMLASSRSDDTYLAIGVRGGIELSVYGPLALRLSGNLLAAWRPQVQVLSAPGGLAAGVAGGASFGPAVRF